MRTVLALVLALAPLLQTGGATIPFRTDDAGSVVVPAMLDDATVPWRFLLDTGSSHTIISSAVADALALAPVAKASVQTATGPELQVVVKLNRMAVGAAEARDLLPSVVQSAQLASTAPGIDGIIGQDFLGRFDYTLDYRAQRLRWATVPPAAGDIRLKMIHEGNRVLVQLPAPGAERDVLLVPDSGANAFVLFERGGRTALPIERVPGAAEVAGAIGRSSGAQIARLRELRLGAMSMRDLQTVVIPRDHPDATSADGLLPLHLFATVSFNSRDGYMVVRR